MRLWTLWKFLFLISLHTCLAFYVFEWYTRISRSCQSNDDVCEMLIFVFKCHIKRFLLIFVRCSVDIIRLNTCFLFTLKSSLDQQSKLRLRPTKKCYKVQWIFQINKCHRSWRDSFQAFKCHCFLTFNWSPWSWLQNSDQRFWSQSYKWNEIEVTNCHETILWQNSFIGLALGYKPILWFRNCVIYEIG